MVARIGHLVIFSTFSSIKIEKKEKKNPDIQTVERHPRMVHAQGNVSRMFTVLKKCT